MKKEFRLYNDPDDKDNGEGEETNPPDEKEKPEKPS